MVDRDGLPTKPNTAWDYEIPDDAHHDEAFLRWYIARELTRGRMEAGEVIGRCQRIKAQVPSNHSFWR